MIISHNGSTLEFINQQQHSLQGQKMDWIHFFSQFRYLDSLCGLYTAPTIDTTEAGLLHPDHQQEFAHC